MLLLEFLKVIKIENELNGFKWDSSILITDKLMLEIYSFIKSINKSRFWIKILSPINTEKELSSISSKYSSLFKDINFKIQVKNYNSPQFGSCVMLEISKY